MHKYMEVVYAANVKPGDLVLGSVNPDAPTTPVQPMARGLVVESVQVIEDPANSRRKYYLWTWAGGIGAAGARSACAQVMVLREVAPATASCDHSPAALDVVEVSQCECGALIDTDTGRVIGPVTS